MKNKKENVWVIVIIHERCAGMGCILLCMTAMYEKICCENNVMRMNSLEIKRCITTKLWNSSLSQSTEKKLEGKLENEKNWAIENV